MSIRHSKTPTAADVWDCGRFHRHVATDYGAFLSQHRDVEMTTPFQDVFKKVFKKVFREGPSEIPFSIDRSRYQSQGTAEVGSHLSPIKDRGDLRARHFHAGRLDDPWAIAGHGLWSQCACCQSVQWHR
jgi:hypothetical protein